MTRIVSPVTLSIALVVVLVAVSGSSNLELWAACLIALPAMIWLAGGSNAVPVLLFILGLCWFQIVADVIVADLEGRTISDDFAGYNAQAIVFSLCAMLAMALGMRCGKLFYRRVFIYASQRKMATTVANNRPIELNRVLISYVISIAAVSALQVVATHIPNLTQPILSFSLIKFTVIYLLATTVMDTQRGYMWLALVALIELATGMTGYFSNYKEPIFVILIAFATVRPKLNARILVLLAASVAAILYISVVWSSNQKRLSFYYVQHDV